MDLVVEDGTGIAGANSYVDLTYANDYFANHPFYADSWATIATDDRKKQLLAYAATKLNLLFTWVVYPPSLDWYLSSTGVPENLKKAQCELAYWYSTPQGNPDTIDSTNGISEVKIDVIDIKFASSKTRPGLPVAVLTLLRGLTDTSFSSRVRRVQVGLA